MEASVESLKKVAIIPRNLNLADMIPQSIDCLHAGIEALPPLCHLLREASLFWRFANITDALESSSVSQTREGVLKVRTPDAPWGVPGGGTPPWIHRVKLSNHSQSCHDSALPPSSTDCSTHKLSHPRDPSPQFVNARTSSDRRKIDSLKAKSL